MGAHGADRGQTFTRTAALTALVLVLVGTFLVLRHHRDPAPATTPTTPVAAGGSHTPAAPSSTGTAARRTVPFDSSAHSTTDPASIWVVVNKTHPITPHDFRPDLTIVRGYQVATAAAGPLGDLLDAGDRAGLGFKIESAFRSYAYQVQVHSALVASEGAAAADRVSARPGYSEHQTGLAVDLITPGTPTCDFEQCFGRTPAGRWLTAHSWEYGFLVRYTKGNEPITGYSPEPWHLRYVGVQLATAMHQQGVTTLEQFLGIPGGDYPR